MEKKDALIPLARESTTSCRGGDARTCEAAASPIPVSCMKWFAYGGTVLLVRAAPHVTQLVLQGWKT